MNLISKISIVGRGIDPSKHLSLAAVNALKSADKIIGIESEKEFWEELQKEYGIGDVEDMASLYNSQDKDMINYHRFVDHVLSLLPNFNHLALLVAGHPRIGVTFIELLKKNAPANLQINIIEGISSFDVMINYLEIDPLEKGTVIVDANRLLLFQYKLEPSLSYFIYHVCSIGNSTTNFVDPSSGNRLDLLKNYLMKYYSKDKEILLCRASNGKNESSSLVRSTIAELEACTSKIDYSTTLYLPGENPKQLDWAYLELLK